MKFLAAGIILVSVRSPALAGAQGLPATEGVPSALSNPLGFIQDELGIHLDRIFPGFTGEMATPGEVVSGASNLWDNIKVWVQDNLGIDLSHLLRGIIDLLVQLFEFAIKLFKSALELL
jgi:hypothetical protein